MEDRSAVGQGTKSVNENPAELRKPNDAYFQQTNRLFVFCCMVYFYKFILVFTCLHERKLANRILCVLCNYFIKF